MLWISPFRAGEWNDFTVDNKFISETRMLLKSSQSTILEMLKSEAFNSPVLSRDTQAIQLKQWLIIQDIKYVKVFEIKT